MTSDQIREHFVNLLRGKGTARASDVAMILLLGLSISILLTLFIDRLPRHIEVGGVASQDIKADQNYEIVDAKSTEKIRQEASESVLSLYDFDPTVEGDTISKIHAAFFAARQFLEGRRSPKKKGDLSLSDEEEAELKAQFFKNLEVNLTENQYEVLRKYRFHAALEQTLTYLIHTAMEFPIVHDRTEINLSAEKGFVLRKLIPDQNFPEETMNEVRRIQDLEEARKKIMETSLRSLEGPMNLEFLDKESFASLRESAFPFIKINTKYNSLETEERREKAASNIKNIIIKVQAGESIIRSGDRFEPWHVTVINGILKEKMKTNRYLKFIGVFLFVNLFLLIVYYFAAKYIRKFHPNRKDLVFLGLTLILFLVILRVGAFLGSSIRDALPFSVDWASPYYTIPIAGGAMLVRFILNSETAFVFAVILSLFSGIYLENSLEMTIFYLLSGIFAAHSIARADRRSRVVLCGIQAGCVNALTIFSLNLISMIAISPGQVASHQTFINMFAGFLGGIFTSMIVLGLSPMMEALFAYTTDIQLLEMANLSHPLLKEMIVRAPGTYHHSQIVGILSEAAAQGVGANPLLARVGSYYHDIGKMKKPQYFIENQRGGENPHDKLNPSMSALIIESHVKDGQELAAEHKLPKRIADMIPQHQGTKLIGYFYNKAKKIADPSLGKIDERDYRYPGPKPQTREAGIIMLADTVEAAVRSLPEKSPNRIQLTVEKLVNQHFIDEQLDECDLTLRDLHRIAEAFVKILIGIYHQRVEYPEGALLSEAAAGSDTQAEIHYLTQKAQAPYGHLPQQPPPSSKVIAPLFRKKNQEGS